MDIGILRRDGRADPFFDGAAAGRLMIKHCTACDRRHAPDASGCAECGSDDLTWLAATGEATLVTWAVPHTRDGGKAYLALVELAEGPWLYARLDDDVAPTAFREGLPLRARFEHPSEGESYVLFTPV